MRVKHVGPMGNTPDVFVESEEGKYCGIIDNKAYKNGYTPQTMNEFRTSLILSGVENQTLMKAKSFQNQN